MIVADILLVAVNSSYSHTNIAVRSIAEYVRGHLSVQGTGGNVQVGIEFGEWTINQSIGEIICGIAFYKPSLIMFSTYIWNIETVEKLIKNLKVLFPNVIIGCGGPEAGFRGADFLRENPDVDFVMKGEGEETVREIVTAFPKIDFRTIKGVYFRDSTSSLDRQFGASDTIAFTGERDLICDLSVLPFPYPEITDPDHRIYYYESSRGCPFSCAYCMSSLDKKVRFVPLEKVYADLQRFLDAKVKLVKFVDRTYNIDSERYVSIWKYILSHHNGKTVFHFEIEGEFLSEEAIEFLQNVPENVMQFEIGVQSSNPKTLAACGRSPETEKLRANIIRIPKTIHTHLDLIAGLPYEDLESFGRSFDFVMAMKPDALQLGFLKVLYGAPIGEFCRENGWKWMKTPPYEVLETPYLSYNDILFLKDLETTLDAYWDSHNFDKTMEYLSERFGKKMVSPANTVLGDEVSYVNRQSGGGWWNLFVWLTERLREIGAFESAHQKDYWAEMLHEIICHSERSRGISNKKDPSTSLRFAQGDPNCLVLENQSSSVNRQFEGNPKIALELLRFDYIASGKKTNPPEWLERHINKDAHYNALNEKTGITNARLDFAYSDFDTFFVNPLDATTWGNPQCESPESAESTTESTEPKSFSAQTYSVLFLYARRPSDNPTPSQQKSHQFVLCTNR